jgi:predicted ATPase/class 3 adenylate cyclase
MSERTDHPSVRELPSGTVTFLFTDIEASTRLLHELGDGYADALAKHRRLFREAFVRYGGVEVDTQGDAFFVAFPRAQDAVDCAAAAQKALDGGPVRVRMGLHTGEPRVTSEGYVGMEVHAGARIAGVGHGGQVLVSEATRQLLADGEALRDLGEHRLKDLSAPQRLYQLGEDEFPPLRTLYRTNLPVQQTALIGRNRELGEVCELLGSNRLLTIVGPGGSGKTRLALQVAAESTESFPDGVFWVPLQALRDPALVQRTVETWIGADGGLVEHVGSKRLLMLLDNFEQVVEAAQTVAELLAATPSAKVLVTSREPLHIESEQRYPLEPLADDDAELLFIQRALAVSPDFRRTPAVGEICRRLDGLPLAIELAAARVALLEPDELLARLERRLPLLASRARDAPARQRTLRAAIEWSYELLQPEEQELFRRLAAFRGSFSIEAAEAVFGADVDALESLVVKSLLRRWTSGRLGMLDTIREYALDALEASPEVDEIRRRHAEYFLTVMQGANLSAGNLAPGGQHIEIAALEQDNARAALTWALASGSVELGLKIAVALEQFWVVNDPAEGVRWFQAFFESPDAEAVKPETRAHALRACASSTHIGGDPAGAEELCKASLALFEQLGDEHGRAVLLHRLSITTMIRGDLVKASELVEASERLHERSEDWGHRTWGLAQTRGTLGAIERDLGDDGRALELLRESSVLARDAGVTWWRGGVLAELGALSLRAGQLAEAESNARESLTIAAEQRDWSGRIFGVGLLACVAAEHGDLDRAGRLWGAIEDETAFAPLGGWQRHRAECEARILAHSNPELERALAEGRNLELDEAVELALTAID